MSTPITRVHVWVSGRVQGVYYRASTRARARELDLAGWVRNLSDGRVEAVFEGTPDAAASAVAWCRTGPPGAAVESVETREEPAEGLTGFGSGPPAD